MMTFKNALLTLSIVLALSIPAVFAELTIEDIDGDGTISAAELSAAFEAQKEAFVATYDTDEDGELSRDERGAAVIELYDTDGDGEISRYERQAASDENRAIVEAAFDTDCDGELSDDEQETLYETLSEVKSGNGSKHGGLGKGH